MERDEGHPGIWMTSAEIKAGIASGTLERGTVEREAQGLGLALMEEIQTRDGRITNASFTDYLIPTALDMPPVESVLIEVPEPTAPYGAKGVGEPPTVVAAAVTLSVPIAGPNPLPVLGALGAGFFWSFLAARSGRLTPGVFSHAALAYFGVAVFRVPPG